VRSLGPHGSRGPTRRRHARGFTHTFFTCRVNGSIVRMGLTTGDARGDDDHLEETAIHDVLRNTRRRLALDCLQETPDNTLEVRELSERVAALETGEDPPPRDKRQSVYVSLHQTHLPKLDDLDVIRYDPDTKEVSLGERIWEVRVFMEVVPEYGLSWGEYYLAVAVLGTLTLAATAVGVPVIGTIPSWFVGLAFTVGVAVSAVYNVYSQQSGWPFSWLL